MIRLTVWITLEGGNRLPAGELVCTDPDDRGRMEGEFRYTGSYIAAPAAVPLDPVSLPLRRGIFPADRPCGIHHVFEDALPDVWGRKLLVRKTNLPRGRQTVPELLRALGGAALGALSFFEKDFKSCSDNFASVHDLDTLMAEANRFEQGLDVDPTDISLLLQAGSSPGGGRPKALVQKDDGSQWIAKFPDIRDRLDVVRMEAATMALAAEAGIDVPDTRLVDVAGRPVLLVRRFDIVEGAGRRHMISFQTLLKAEGFYQLGYQDLFEVLQRYGAAPEKDIPRLFRQMAFNALMGNTDDHLKNFIAFGGRRGVRLSPAFDLLPDTDARREHVLHFTYGNHFPGTDHLVRFGRRIGVAKAASIVEEVRRVLIGWRAAFKAKDVPAADVDKISPLIERRIG